MKRSSATTYWMTTRSESGSRINKAGLLFGLFYLLLIPADLLGDQRGVNQSGMSSADKASIEIRQGQNVYPAGSTGAVAVQLNLDPDWHVNSNTPSLDFLIGTELQISEPESAWVTDILYPDSKRYSFDFAEEPVDVYEGDAPIFLSLTIPETTEPGNYDITGTLVLQACNNEVCLAPATTEITIPIEVTAPGTGFQPMNEELFASYEAGSRSIVDALTASGSGEIAALFQSLGLFWALAGIFLIGLALNLTPCIYPMLSITVSLFGTRKGEESRISRSFFMASIYVLGIVTMYSVLGVAAAYTGALFGSWLQSPWVLGGIGLLIFGLALSMFGLYELQPPASLMQKLSGAQRKTTGIAGHFVSGLVVGVFAAPCIGPPVIALLAFVGAQGDPLFGFLVFFVMALGLGFPYLILGTFSGLLNNLPQSGTWMVWVKKLFGVILTGVALFYLALAIYPSWTMHVVIATLLAGGIYLGFFEQSRSAGKGFVYLKRATGIAAILISVLMIQNLMKEGIVWEPYTAEKLEQAAAEGKPVVMDFYADWCIPCLELERTTFTDPEVIDRTESFVRLKVDLTQYGSPESQQLRDEFQIAGVPTIVFLTPGGIEVESARVVGYLRSEQFLQRVETALEASQ